MQDPSFYSQIKAQVQQPQPQFPEQEHLKCPRCDSTNTKFCYYNNYNLSQPRHFCKNCRRYWTKGGALRNIPVGGGTRKNTKRSSAASASASSAAAKRPSPATNIKSDSKSNNGETNETLDVKGENFVEQFGNLVDGCGSFSSLLCSNGGQFGNFIDDLGPNGSRLQINDQFSDPSSGQNVDPHVLESDSNSNADGFLNINGGDGVAGGSRAGGGDSGCWSGGSNGWADLAIYTPRSSFM